MKTIQLKVPKEEFADYVMVEQQTIVRRGHAYAKLKAFLLGFFWCFIPFGILCSLFLAMRDKRHSFYYLIGILLFVLLAFTTLCLIFAG